MNAQLKPLPFRELMIGCGSSRVKQVYPKDEVRDWHALTTLDINPSHQPDVVHDLNVTPWPFEDDSFDEIHAYEILEHIGKQGDYVSFFAHFTEIWRILKPSGKLFASSPMWDAPWAWSDPGHTRVISRHSLIFLNQAEYSQVGTTSISDYRNIYHADLEMIGCEEKEHTFAFILRAIKPARLQGPDDGGAMP